MLILFFNALTKSVINVNYIRSKFEYNRSSFCQIFKSNRVRLVSLDIPIFFLIL